MTPREARRFAFWQRPGFFTSIPTPVIAFGQSHFRNSTLFGVDKEDSSDNRLKVILDSDT
jgi:hypothetical protein